MTSSTKKTKKKDVRHVLTNYDNQSNDTAVNFWITLDPEYFHEARAFPAEFEKRFKLVGSVNLTNMVAFDCDGAIKKYNTVGEILEEFYAHRLQAYVERKANELARLEAEVIEMDSKARFVKAVVNEDIVVANAEDDALLKDLKDLKLPPLSNSDADAGLRGYEYLLRMRVDRLKAKAVLELEADVAKIKAERDELAGKSPED